MSPQTNIESLRKDTEETMSKFVRSDVSLTVVLLGVFGVIAAVAIHWTVLLFALTLAYMTVGVSVVWEWNKHLQETGMVSRTPFSNVTATGFIPAILVVVGMYFQGHPFGGSAMLSIIVLGAYQFTLYAIGFKGLESDEVYFERDPFDGDQRVYREEVYIPRLEERAIQKAKENRGTDE